ncbi:MAG TPA: tetratricopeptide repeat protein [Bryobacteraceae bacterium]|nr:tetratricopeptide repeat protein [Bryobacteraceae bacterium]
MTAQRAYRLIPAAIALVTILAFLPALRNNFVNFDDQTNFLGNDRFRGLGWAQLQWMWTSHLLGRYVPLTWMTLGLDYCIWGMNPLGYHLTNILWHAANAVVFYFLAMALLRRAIPDRSLEMQARIPLGALFAGLIFALHPLRVESVAWVTERRDLVSGLFYLLAILAYVRGAPRESGRPVESKYYWGSFAFFVLGLLSKEMVVTLPAVLLILDVYPLRRLAAAPGGWLGADARRVWREKIPFFAASIVMSVITLYNGVREKLVEPLDHVSLFDHFAIVMYGLAFYLRKTLLPMKLTHLYALTAERLSPNGLPFLLSVAAILLLTVLVWIMRRRFPALAAVSLAYAITLSPVSGLFHNGRQIAADRYSYLPCLGWALLAGAALLYARPWDWRGPARTMIFAAAGLVVAVLAVLTWRQIGFWRDSDTLWTRSIEVDSSYLTQKNMGDLLAQEGDYLLAIDHLREATLLKPDYAPAHLNLGGALLSVGRPDEAIREFQKVLELGELNRDAETDLGAAFFQQGKLDEAIQHFQRAIQIDPEDREARRNLAQALARKNAERAKH